ncbi:MAG: dihydrolipoyl dehydrogenase [Thermoplasmatota archaeon]
MTEKLTVIGSGPGGYKSAILAAENGLDVTLIEKRDIGGVCTNRGCIPSKALLSIAERIDDIESAGRRGIKATLNGIDFDKIRSIKERAVMTSRKGIEKQLEENGINIIQGEGELIDKDKVQVDDNIVESDYIIIATGSEPIVLPGLAVDERDIFTSNGALELKDIPESMVIIGGGYIGIELAFVYSSFGTDVTIVELMDRVLPNMDRDLSEETEKILKRKRIKVYTDSKVIDVNGEKPFTIKVEGGVNKDLEVEKVLCAVGRKPTPPNTELNEIIGEKGEVVADEKMRTRIESIYAVGDVNGKSMLAHSAYKQAEIAVSNIVGKETIPFSKYHVPAGVYIHPEIASVGLTEEEAVERFKKVQVGKFPVSASGRGYSTGERSGLAKIIANDDKILGVHLICPGATDIIMEGTVAMESGIDINRLSDIIHPHPTYSEILKKAADKTVHK